MESFSSLQQNIEVLTRKMVDLKHTKHQVATREGRHMDGWLENVEGRERELDEIRKEFEKLGRESYDAVNLKVPDALSQKAIENLEAVTLLRDEGNASIESSPVPSNKMEHKTVSHEDLIKFTSGFAENIGSGAFSNVYIGQLDDDKQVAVKVLKKTVAIGDFMAEMQTMVTASHPNLATLYGFCFDYNMKALVYEFMKNGSLDKVLFNNHLNLEWGTLYGIALGTAKGLAYLHDGCGKHIFHRDIKPSNVLLDENLSPKITDFGLAKLVSKDANHYTITNNQGTPGYIAPEFGNPTAQITKKCDVYSFGVTLFEVLGKRRNGQFGPKWFPLQVWKKFEKGQLDELIESFGIPETHKGKAKILSMVGFWCTQFTVDIRPSMSIVVEVLEKEISVNTPPYPFEPKTSLDFSMLPSEASPVIHESLAISNPTLAVVPDMFNNAHQEEEKKEEEGKYSNDEQAISNFPEPVLSEESKTSSEIGNILSELAAKRPQQFSRSDIESFTSKFSVEIGSGWYGDVYKGQFLDGMQVAIKVLKDDYYLDKSFMDVVMMKTGKVYHRNIIKLYGYCFDGDMKALVSEYMEGGSLDKILYGNHHLEWELLFKIAIETARGLSALHAVGITHGDIKASSILLDHSFTPKIHLCGLEDLIYENYDMTRPRGTAGYTAPEAWIPTAVVTSKSDVYSFGMFLFEVLGMRSNRFGRSWFPAQVWKMFNEGLMGILMDDCRINIKDRKIAYNLSKVALWCAQYEPRDRPSMISVVKMLEMEIEAMAPPNPFPNTHYGSSTSSSSEASPSIELSFAEKRKHDFVSFAEKRKHDFVSFAEKRKLEERMYSFTDWDEKRELELMLSLFEEKCPPGGENSVVLYTRSVGWLGRSTACNDIRSILKSHQIEIIERGLAANLANWVELRKLLGTTKVPALFVHGRYIGGVDKVKSLEQEGMLKILLNGIQRQ